MTTSKVLTRACRSLRHRPRHLIWLCHFFSAMGFLAPPPALKSLRNGGQGVGASKRLLFLFVYRPEKSGRKFDPFLSPFNRRIEPPSPSCDPIFAGFTREN